MDIDRRTLIRGAIALAGLTGLARVGLAAVDVAKLNEPSPIGEMTMGPDNAKVTVIEYASASCPHCANFYKTTFQELKKQYIDTGKIRFVFREFPHNDAALAAFMIARCAPKDKYFPLIDTYFQTQDSWLENPAEGLFKIAQLAGFTKASFDACLKNEEVAKGIIAVRDKAESEFGVTGIPTFFINGKILNGEATFDQFKKVIDPQLT
jgi:protein-disulfide isomerase